MKIHAGTSGFAFKEWKGPFYPEKMKDEDMLGFYAGKFPTVEINNTFYRLPKETVLVDWAAQVPDGFTFAIKASQKITHFARLKPESADAAAVFRDPGPAKLWPINALRGAQHCHVFAARLHVTPARPRPSDRRDGRVHAMNVAPLLTERDDRWWLPCWGERVIQVRVSYQLTLLFESGITVDMETEALLTHGPLRAPGASPLTLRPQLQDVAPALELFTAKVVSAVALKSGALRLVFDTGHHLNVQPHPELKRGAQQVPALSASSVSQAAA